MKPVWGRSEGKEKGVRGKRTKSKIEDQHGRRKGLDETGEKQKKVGRRRVVKNGGWCCSDRFE